MAETLEEIKEEINKFCTAKVDSKSCIQGALLGFMTSKKLVKRGKAELIEETEDYITKKLI